jgi:HSP20 family protein
MRENIGGILMNVLAKGSLNPHHEHRDDVYESFGSMDVYLEDQVLVVELNVPGVSKDQISVQLDKGTALSISGTRAVRDDKTVFLRKERGEGRFERLLALPFPVDADRVDAKYEFGVLTLKLPRLASSLPRRIPVNQNRDA